MSDPILTIDTRQDYNRVQEQRTAALDATRVENRKLGRTGEQAAHALATAELPYARTLTDPANKKAAMFALREKFANPDIAPNLHLLSPQENPQIFDIINRETAALNAKHGTNYLPSRVIMVDGLARDNDGSPLLFDRTTDSVRIDASFAEMLRHDPDASSALLGHELTHRYQRSDAAMTALLETKYLDTPTPQILAISRTLESEADASGAALSSPQAMARGLTQAFNTLKNDPYNQAYELYQQQFAEGTRPPASDYNNLFGDEKKALVARVEALPEAERALLGQSFLNREIALEQTMEAQMDHPSYNNRMAALLGNNFIPPAGMKYDADAPVHDATTGTAPVIARNQAQNQSAGAIR